MRCARSLLGIILLASMGLGGCIIITEPDGDSGGETDAMDGGTQMADGGTGPASCFDPPQCDPLAPTCAQSKCVPNDEGFSCAPTMPGMEEFGEGEACNGALSCQAGLVCLALGGSCAGAEGCCVALCDVAQSQCPGDTTCMPYFAQSAPCYEDVGVCLGS